MNKKIIYGQFFTKNNWWLKDKKHIQDFIVNNSNKKFLDPFVGNQDLLKTIQNDLFDGVKLDLLGFDIDNKLVKNAENIFWNDSLLTLENNLFDLNNFFIITNPPFLSKVSSKRKKIYNKVSKYFSKTNLDDLYKVALKKLIESKLPGLAIVPESFINSNLFLELSENINLVTTIIPNPFEDTQVPVCVICFNGKDQNKTIFYINDQKIYNIDIFLKLKNKSKFNYNLSFNNKDGEIGLKAVDSSNSKDIGFLDANYFNYSRENIKISSRVMTYIKIDNNIIKKVGINQIIDESNRILNLLRLRSKDIIFTPFKGNIKSINERRRRLDYKMARNILEKAIENLTSSL